jgi:hypothetical protein
LGTLLALYCISTPPQVAGLALYQRVCEVINVAAGGPNSRVHHDRCVETYYIIPILDYGLPPGLFNIALKLHSHRAIIPTAS